MTSIGVRSVPWADTLRSSEGGPWVTCKVESRVEFVIDDKTVTDLGQIDAQSEHVTLVDITDSKRASGILMGRFRLDEDFPPVGGLPLLGCPCSNPGEGSLTVRLMVDEASVPRDPRPRPWIRHPAVA